MKDITSFNVRVSSAEQVSSVEVRGWDYKTKKAIVSTKTDQTNAITSIGHGEGKKISTEFKTSPKMIVVDKPVFSTDEADTIAQALFNELSGEFVQADAKAIGNPDLRPGKKIELTDMGKYSGSYYVTETRHIFEGRIYTTEFSVRGLRGDDLFTVINTKPRLQPGQTMLIGIVTNNNDPKKWGRVRVKFPTLTEAHESDWARVVSIGAGANRGFDCLPEVNDEVLVAFEHGDIHRPFVIGGVWNGKDKPPTPVTDSVADGKVRLRTIKTRLGHTLQFVEEDKGSSKKGIYLKTASGNQVDINDTEEKITIKTNGGHQVVLDDKTKKIEIKTSGGQSNTLSDNARKITLSATGEIELTAPQKISLKSGGSSIEVSPTSVKLAMGGNTIELSPAGININSAMTLTMKGLTATLQGNATAAVSAPIVNLG